MPPKKGLLLINLGTPSSPTTKSVRKYLKQFLSDRRVVDLPNLFRFLLVNLAILPFRSKKSALAYQKIWSKEGSPLLVNSHNLLESVTSKIGGKYETALGMRYGSPSIKDALDNLSHCTDITVLPLYPQYASSSTGSAVEEVLRYFKTKTNIPGLRIQEAFYSDPDFIQSWVEILAEHQKKHNWDHLLFSYHGLPERHVRQNETGKVNCDMHKACPQMNKANRFCYRAQCYETTRLICDQLGLRQGEFSVGFQSRLGVRKWIKPYTDKIMPDLRKRGVNNLAVVCPSFVSDCLETLEEIAVRGKDSWISLGGRKLTLVPCLNNSRRWVDSVIKMVS